MLYTHILFVHLSAERHLGCLFWLLQLMLLQRWMYNYRVESLQEFCLRSCLAKTWTLNMRKAKRLLSECLGWWPLNRCHEDARWSLEHGSMCMTPEPDAMVFSQPSLSLSLRAVSPGGKKGLRME